MEKKKRPQKKKKSKKSGALQVIQPMVAGIDIGSREHWVCGPFNEQGERQVLVFQTTTNQLEKLAKWLQKSGVKSVAMESTSVYWIPVYEILESAGIEVLLVNARQLHNVPGRKTDKHDCEWLQRLHSCGLLRGSFRPKDSFCRIRTLKRQQANMVYERSRAIQWIQKSLDQMNVQVHHAVSDITGHTGLAIIRAIVNGERDPIKLAELRDARCRKTAEQIAEHLKGNWREEHLFNLKSALHLYDQLEDMVNAYDERLIQELEALQPPERREAILPPHPNPNKEKKIKGKGEQKLRTALYRFSGVDLTRIDGISVGTAMIVMAEVGHDMTSFPAEKNFTSWLRLVPRTPITGGKPVKKKKVRGLGANRIATSLRMAALALKKSKSALGAEFRRISRRKDYSTAVFAIARKLAVLIYRMLRYGQQYVDIGEEAYERRHKIRRLIGIKSAAVSLGYDLVKLGST